jgi:hypothetical protein
MSKASKAPVSTVAKPQARKTADTTDGTAKKRKKARKETYSSYIYKGMSSMFTCFIRIFSFACSAQASPSRHWDIYQGDGSFEFVRE